MTAKKGISVAARKDKGRKGQQDVVKMLLDAFPDLEAGDLRSTSMGASGDDILMSPKAEKLIPFSIEVKRRKAINMMTWINQVLTRSKKSPIVFWREDGKKKYYVSLEADVFIDLLKRAKQ